MLWFCLNVYNEEELIRDCLESLPKLRNSAIIVIDGAYAKFPHGPGKWNEEFPWAENFKPWSTDRTVEICSEYTDLLINCREPWATEYMKRSAFFIGEPGDVYFIVDADERFRGELPSELPRKNMNVMIVDPGEAVPSLERMPKARIIIHESGINMYGAHHTAWAKGKLLNRVDDLQVLEGCYLEHRKKKRDQSREILKGYYYSHGLDQDEKEFRREFSL